MSWRLIVSRPAQGAWNMAMDEAVLHSVAESKSPPTVRFYTWDPGCYSIGRFQRANDLTEQARQCPGVTWVRRPTGGKGIYHGPELTYSVISLANDPHVSGSIVESYRKIASALLEGLLMLGVRAELAPPADHAEIRKNPSCFDNPSDYELLYNGRKLIGSAQMRHARTLLQHGSILIEDPAERFFEGLRFESADLAKRAFRAGQERLTTLSDALGYAPKSEEVARAMTSGFEAAWDLRLEAGDLSESELRHVRELETGKYRSEEWNYRF